jgi:quercetin dioxygenase-like cupin family protein
MVTRLFHAVALLALTVGAASAADAVGEAKITPVFDRALPNAPGKSMRVVLVEYAPGGSTPAHTHPASAFVYATVLEGAIRSSVNDGPEKVYHAGEGFTEMPGDRHTVSANASATEPARLLAVFVVDSDETNLVTSEGN